MYTAFEEIFQKYVKDKGFSGSCMVKSGNEILFCSASGYASKAFKIPNGIDTKFDTASVTKVFTAAAVLQLIEKGLLNFDDCITDIIDLAGTKIPNDVRIEHLLNHTSGIADDAEEEAGEDYAALFIDSPNYAFRECSHFLPNFAYKEPNFKAGTNIRYNNCAFILLGLVIEKISGMDYRTYVTQNIFDVCRMTDTKFCEMDGINENTAEGYVVVYDDAKKQIGFKKNIYSYPPVGTADSGAYTSVGDLDKFLRALKAGQIMSGHYADIFLTPHCDFVRPSSWKTVPDAKVRNGYAFEFLEINNETFCIFKEGQNEGVSAMFSYFPEADITISILSNHNCDVWSMHREMQTEVYYKYRDPVREPVKETFSNKLDLHMHSNISNDGDFEPADLMRLCKESGLETVALTDHNSVRGIAEAKKAAMEQGLGFICGIEIDCHFEGINLHVLGYGINPDISAFSGFEKNVLKQEQDASCLLMQKILDLGIYFDKEKVLAHSIEDVVTGEMIAEAALSDIRNEKNPLLEDFRNGGTRSDNPYVNFYWDFCSQGKPAFVPMYYPDLREVIRVIKEAGGLAVLAHPGINIGQDQQILQGIIACGIDGIEVFSSYHDDSSTSFFSEQAVKNNLLKTMGSDFHGKIKPSIKLGAMNCPEEADIYQNLIRTTSFCAQYK